MNTKDTAPRIIMCAGFVGGPDYDRLNLAIFYAHHGVVMPTTFYFAPKHRYGDYNPFDLYIERVKLDKGTSVIIEGYCRCNSSLAKDDYPWKTHPFIAHYDVRSRTGHVEVYDKLPDN